MSRINPEIFGTTFFSCANVNSGTYDFLCGSTAISKVQLSNFSFTKFVNANDRIRQSVYVGRTFPQKHDMPWMGEKRAIREQMNAIKKWAEGKPPFLAFYVISQASGAISLYELLRGCRSRAIMNGFSIVPSPEQWMEFYFNHKRVESVMLEAFQPTDGLIKDMLDYDAVSSKIKQEYQHYESSDQAPQELIEAAKDHFNDGLHELLNKQIEASAEGMAWAESVDVSDEVLDTPELMFTMVVAVPCWLMYREFPATMLRKARQGSEEHIEKLLRLDPSALADRKVMAHFQALRFKSNPALFKQLLQCLEKPPRLDISMRKVKMSMAGLISLSSEKLGCRLERPDIRDLFDAIAQARGEGDIDTDLPDDPAAFTKAIQREREYWQAIY